MALRVQGKDKKWLAKQLDLPVQRISTMVKGKENFTLKTISKLEVALNIELLTIITEKERNTMNSRE
jgi:plasmid maintenance system antidote protein VapI